MCFRKVKDERYQIILFDINSGSEIEIIFWEARIKKRKVRYLKYQGIIIIVLSKMN